MRISQGRSGRPSRFALGALEVPVGLQEGLLGQILRVVMVAHPVVGVAVDVAQVGPIELRELGVELRLRLRGGLLGHSSAHYLHAAAGTRQRARPRAASHRSGAALAHGGLRPAEPLPLQADARPDAVGHARGERGRGSSRRSGTCIGRPALQPHLAGADAPAPAHLFGADDRDRRHGSARFKRQPPDAAPGAPRAGPCGSRVPSGKTTTQSPRARISRAVVHRVAVAGAAVDGEGSERVEDPCLPAASRTARAWPCSRRAA